MKLFRFSSEKYSKSLDGEGAKMYGGRWNSKGVPVIYTSNCLSTAMLEKLIHIEADICPPMKLITYELPDNVSVKRYNIKDLKKIWNVSPHDEYTQLIGDRFVNENKYLILDVPSAIAPLDRNIILNPNHREIKEISIFKIEDFTFDPRFFKPLY